ncbi:hypothetical protein ABW636_06335 [Aquimarina sp. 2201CG1-2-11]|uniref:hypothetical protein n=1 Tax=Aquimarina discodermiae TaxID=3231043 RepID=UPI0034622CBE
MDYNSFKSRVGQLIEERKSFHPNDDLRTYKYWEEISDFMAADEISTIKFLEECDKETASWMSEVFEDLSERLKSNKFIDCLERLAKRFPDQNLESFIQDARSFL